MRKAAALGLLLLMPVMARAQDALTAAANAFYSASVAAGASGGGVPNAATRVRFQPLLSARLNKLLSDGAAAEARFKARNKDAPPLIEGDIFSSLFEGPTQFKVGVCLGDAKIQRCAIALSRQDPGQKSASWTDTLVLTNEAGWKVDDIAYDANFAFGNTGTLDEMLKMTVSEAP